MTPADWAKRYRPGPAWDGRGKGPMTQADVESFGDYPLFWLGDSFAGYNLQWVGRVQYDAPPDIPNARPWDAVTFIYGTCTPSDGQTRCAAPITVHVRPGCAVRPEMIADRVRAGGLETVRGGAQVHRFSDGHVVLWGNGVSVSIQAPGMPDLVDQAMLALRGLGRAAAIGAGEPIPAPDFSGCPPLDLEAQRIVTE